MRETYREFKVSARKSGKCPCCGKRIARQKTFYQTMNPFNLNAEGIPKSASEIFASLEDEAAEWRSEPVSCGASQ